MKKIASIFLLAFMFLVNTSVVSAATYTKAEFLTIMLNYKYSENYTVSSSSYKCGDTSNTLSESNWELDIDDLNIDGETEDTGLYFGGDSYALTGTIKKKSGKYKIKMSGGYASEQASGTTADVTVTGTLKKKNPYTITKLKIRVEEHRSEDFAVRECVAKATVKNMEAYTFIND